MNGLPMSRIIKFMLKHYDANPDNPVITVGVISTDPSGSPVIQWSGLQDPKVS